MPPPAPTSAPATRPTSSDSTARSGLSTPWMPRSAARPAMATSTIGVTIPSLSPLSTFSARRTRGGTRGLDMTGAPSAASVGASAAPTRRAAHGSRPSTSIAAPAPSATVSGRPTPSSRAYVPRSCRNWSSRTREASAKRTQTSVTSATSRTSSGSTSSSNRWNPSVNSQPAATNTIGAVSPAGCRRPARTHQTRMVARTAAIARSSMRRTSGSTGRAAYGRRGCSRTYGAQARGLITRVG